MLTPQEKASLSILIVDDEPKNIQLLGNILKMEGYLVQFALSGEEALEFVESDPFDAILLDIMMPGMNGLEVCQHLKRKEQTHNIPVIFFTARDDPESIVQGFLAGAVDYIIKPFHKQEVLMRIETHLALDWERSKLQQEVIKHQKTEQELKQYRDHLEDRVTQRTVELRTANDQLLQEIEKRRQAEQDLKQSHERLQKLGAYQERVREAERTRIAREIHDELGQALTAFKMDVAWMQKRIPMDNAYLHQKIGAMLGLIDTTIQSVQRISRELRPGLLDNLGLVAAIEWQTQEFRDRMGLEVHMELDSEDGLELHPDLSTAIFRIVQELLTNITRHAQAKRVGVCLRQQQADLTLIVSDDGVGITEEQIHGPESFGLMGIQERLDPWNGTVEMMGTPNQGTTVTVRVPVWKKKGDL